MPEAGVDMRKEKGGATVHRGEDGREPGPDPGIDAPGETFEKGGPDQPAGTHDRRRGTATRTRPIGDGTSDDTES